MVYPLRAYILTVLRLNCFSLLGQLSQDTQGVCRVDAEVPAGDRGLTSGTNVVPGPAGRMNELGWHWGMLVCFSAFPLLSIARVLDLFVDLVQAAVWMTCTLPCRCNLLITRQNQQPGF